MKNYRNGIMGIGWAIILLSLGCGTASQEIELRELHQKVLALQGQLSHVDKRLESVANDVIVLQAQTSQERSPRSSTKGDKRVSIFPGEVPEGLEVIKLKPQAALPTLKSELGIHGGVPVGGEHSSQLKKAPLSPLPALGSTDDPLAKPLLKQGLAAYQNGKYDDAILAFKEFVGAYEGNSKYADALYWLAQSYFEKKKFGKSVAVFKEYFSVESNGNKGADALLKLGLAYKRVHALNEARVVFKKLLAQYPKSALADLAKAHLNEQAEITR